MAGRDEEMSRATPSAPGEYLLRKEFRPKVAEKRFPNAKRHLEKGLLSPCRHFISWGHGGELVASDDFDGRTDAYRNEQTG